MSTATTKGLRQYQKFDSPQCKLILYPNRLKKHKYKCSNWKYSFYGLCANCCGEHEHSSLLSNTSFCLPQKKDDSFPNFFKSSKDLFYNCDTSSHGNMQDSDGILSPEPKFISFSGIVEDSRYKYELSMDRYGLLSRHSSPNVPLPRQYQPPTPNHLSINPLELELMLYLQDNFLPKSLYDKSMRWTRKAFLAGYQFDSCKAKTLRRRLDTCFPPLSTAAASCQSSSVKELYLTIQWRSVLWPPRVNGRGAEKPTTNESLCLHP